MYGKIVVAITISALELSNCVSGTTSCINVTCYIDNIISAEVAKQYGSTRVTLIVLITLKKYKKT